jgi:aminopeptidase N
MNVFDPIIHPAMLDPRQWADVDLYELAPGVDREPVPGEPHDAPDRHFEVRHLRLELNFDFDTESISGSARITLSPLSDGFNHLDLDAAEMSIAGVNLMGADKSSLSFETFSERIGIELDRYYARNEQLEIEVLYSCRPRKGLFFIKPHAAYPDRPRQIWSQGETEDAHWWFPCVDTPRQKMSTELIATVRDGFSVLSNGVLVAESEDAIARTRTFHWLQQEPHAAYLVTVAIGDYERLHEQVDGIPVDHFVYRNKRGEGQRLFSNTVQMIPFFAERFGRKYPYAKYSQVLVDDFIFGAMENTSATTMTDRVLLDTRAAIDIDYDDIVAHELAHQWWGNLVTCRHWSEIWLHESFATYAEHLWREKTRGEDETRFALFQDFMVYLREDWLSHRRPIVSKHYRFSDELLDRHAYEKGACVVSMLRHELGDEPFFRALSHYLNKFANGVAQTDDFRLAIEESTGRNLHAFFSQWLHKPGYPELEVEYEWQREQSMLRLSVQQKQTQNDKDVAIFRFPVEVEIVTADTNRLNYRVVVEKAEQEFYFPCASKPRMVLFDKGHRIFKAMSFSKSLQELQYQLSHDEDVMGRVRAARELAGFKSDDATKTLALTLSGSDFWGVRLAAALSLGQIGGEEARAALIEAFRNSNDSHVRRGCAIAMGHFKDEAAIDFLREALDKDESYFVGVAAIRALSHIGGDRAYDILSAALARKSWQEVVRSAVFHGFAAAKEKRAVEQAIAHSRFGEHPALRNAAIACLGSLGKELRKDKKEEKVVDHLIELLKDPAVRPRWTAVRALGKIGDPRALAPLQEAQRRECLDGLRGALQDAIEGIEKTNR